MSTYEVLSLLFLGGFFLIALLAYIDRNKKRKKINLPCTWLVEVGLFHKLNLGGQPLCGRSLLLCL
ncbi:hypothetical protein D3Z53_05040 [Lachnospiraceae bacterium]|jgi:hypothetical protein|nr:putative holin-like toxin [uncultured Schaedlerella sp.]NBI57445.1 hypothetical protein [Lachnospiraceae bacterium]